MKRQITAEVEHGFPRECRTRGVSNLGEASYSIPTREPRGLHENRRFAGRSFELEFSRSHGPINRPVPIARELLEVGVGVNGDRVP